MNDTDIKDTIRCITLISVAALVVGATLMFRGYQGGEIALTIASSGLSGLVGYLGGKGTKGQELSVSSLSAEISKQPTQQIETK